MTNSQIISNASPQFKSSMTDKEYQVRLRDIRRKMPPGKRRGKSHPTSVIQSHDFFDSWDMMISGVLYSLSKRDRDYLFNEDQVVEILRYRPDAKISYLGDSYWSVVC